MPLVVLEHTNVVIATLVEEPAIAIHLVARELPLLYVGGVKDNPRNAIYHFGTRAHLPLSHSFAKLIVLELNFVVLEMP